MAHFLTTWRVINSVYIQAKKEEKPKQEKKEKPKKEEKKEEEEPLMVVEKKKDPLDALPKGTFDLEVRRN